MFIRRYSIIVHCLLTVLFIWYHSPALLIMTIAPILHILVVKYDSFCYQ